MNWKKDEIHNANMVSSYYDALYHTQLINLKHEKSFISFILSTVPLGNKVLNLGSGTGTLSRMLHEYYVIIELDISSDMLKHSDNPSVQADGETIPFHDNTFDAIICSNTLHHFPSLVNIMHEVFRVLRPKGKLIIMEPNHEFQVIHKSISKPIYLLTGLLRKINFALYDYDFAHDEVTDHHRDLSHTELYNSLSNFKILKTTSKYYLSPYFVLFKNNTLCSCVLHLDSVINTILPDNGRYIFIIGEKPGV